MGKEAQGKSQSSTPLCDIKMVRRSVKAGQVKLRSASCPQSMSIDSYMLKKPLLLVALFATLALLFVGFYLQARRRSMPEVQTSPLDYTKTPSTNTPTSPALSSSQLSASSTASWKSYRNEEYGFEVKYPDSWVSVNALGSYNSIELFNFATRHGYKATFGIDKFPPVQEGKMIDEYRSTYSKSNSNLQTYDTLIGSELGFETGGILCEVGNSCAARFEFLSNMLLEKGFKFFLVISDFYGRESSPTLTPSDDPYFLFNEEVLTTRKVLSTFKLTE